MNRNRLAFEDQTKTVVKLDGKVVGHIHQVPFVEKEGVNVLHDKTALGVAYQLGYQYTPKGSKIGGEVFKTKGECMYSLYDLGND